MKDENNAPSLTPDIAPGTPEYWHAVAVELAAEQRAAKRLANSLEADGCCVRFRQGPSRAGAPMQPLRLRVSPVMADAISKTAAGAGQTNAAWVRAALADRLGLDAQADRQPVRRYGGAPADVQALTALRMQFHMLGGLLVQTTKAARERGEPSLHADAEATLADIRTAIQAVAAWQEGMSR